MVELLRDTAKLHQPNEEILTDVKAESFVFVMDSVLSALNESESYGKCLKGRAGYKPRSCKKCKLYKRRDEQ